jgi:hypothetical protein
MRRDELARWMLEQETRALLRRIDRVKPFSLQETMVPAAGLMPAALIAIEQYLMADRRRLRTRVLAWLAWLRRYGPSATPAELQRRYTSLRLAFNTALSQLDLFSEAITQRSEAESGVWLSGLDVAAQDLLNLEGGYYEAPPAICFLHRGLGGAIRRARTRLPGGGNSPAALIRIPRERMIGFGVASSLAHEVGHQAAALLNLVPSLRASLLETRGRDVPQARPAWVLWERWISEIVADVLALAKIGISSTLGLIGIVSLPRPFVFRVKADDPHPFPWIRVLLSCAVGHALYPHQQWRELADTWEALYPLTGLDAERGGVVRLLQHSVPRFVDALLEHRPPALRGRSLGESLVLNERAPQQLSARFESWRAAPSRIWSAPPGLIFATLGRARITGRLTPEEEDRILGRLITHWALKSTLDIAELCAASSRPGFAAPVALPGRSAFPTPNRLLTVS